LDAPEEAANVPPGHKCRSPSTQNSPGTHMDVPDLRLTSLPNDSGVVYLDEDKTCSENHMPPVQWMTHLGATEAPTAQRWRLLTASTTLATRSTT
jgi:hypothetical protein